MRRVWMPLMFTEDDPARLEKLPGSAVGPIRKSQSAKRKASSRKTAEGLAVQSFEGLIKQLAILTHTTKEDIL